MTGITDEMVAGRSIDPAADEAFIADAAIVIAHSASSIGKCGGVCWPTPACSPTQRITARERYSTNAPS